MTVFISAVRLNAKAMVVHLHYAGILSSLNWAIWQKNVEWVGMGSQYFQGSFFILIPLMYSE
jgi:hypothetical protein